jgi:hypothetical protein
MDETGKTYRGFVDASGKQVHQILDETGAMFDAASGWAAEKWEQVKTTAQDLAERAVGTANLQEKATDLNTFFLTQFRDQPLVGGALAFAVGAAIGAALPRTETEDQLAGEASDAAKDALGAQTSELVDRGKAVASDVFERAVEVASDAHDEIKDRLSEEVDALKGSAATGQSERPKSQSRSRVSLPNQTGASSQLRSATDAYRAPLFARRRPPHPVASINSLRWSSASAGNTFLGYGVAKLAGIATSPAREAVLAYRSSGWRLGRDLNS